MNPFKYCGFTMEVMNGRGNFGDSDHRVKEAEADRTAITEMESASAAITKYYDSLTEFESEEDRAWGKAAESQFL